jgi:hypothetical protein
MNYESNAPDEHERRGLIGRFIVETAGMRHVGLAAHDVLAMLDATPPDDSPQPPEAPATIYLINRQTGEGGFELIGVSVSALRRASALVLSYHDVRRGRAAFDAIAAAGNSAAGGSAAGNSAGSEGTPGKMLPPCRLEVQFARAPSRRPPVALVVRFPEPCLNAVAAWLARVAPGEADQREAGGAALEEYESAAPHVMERATVEPAAM